ncbi:MAG: hypothetical protein NTZ09_03795 [Candidatus Hydrogenedentes bacterium]|nr:hypothetical protein [Candidatus Hydrogenedentota bacterium]
MSLNDFDMNKARELREKVKAPFIRQVRKEFLTTLLATVPFMVLAVYATSRWAQTWGTTETPPMFYAMVYGFVLLFLVQLWGSYASSARLLLILKEVKQLRLDFLASQETPEPAIGGAESAMGDAEAFVPNWPVMAVRPKRIALLVATVFVLVPILASVAYMQVDNYRRIHWADYEAFGGQEMLNIHLTADGRARAFSRISVTKCPSLVASIPIHIAQPDATLESITVDGRTIPFDPVPGQANTYTLMPGLPENALKNAVLEVVWSFPPKDMGKIQLEGLIPINSYAVNAVIDPGAPYQFSGKEAGRKTFNLFWTKRSDGGYTAKKLGTCGIGIEPLESGDQSPESGGRDGEKPL